ncbi:MAG: hypothetical protein D6766_06795 [Verrucomicrobia bacterium]|nr:MAG: hypothetical protein D6766_06795 [Verrucomicrobiota bacterium]
MKITIHPTLLLAVLLSWPWLLAASPPESAGSEANLKADHLLRQARMEALLGHYKTVVRQAAETELEADMVRAKLAETPSAKGMLEPLEARLELLRRRAAEVEGRIRELVAAELNAERELKAPRADRVQHWRGWSVGGKELVLELKLEGETGRFVVEGAEGRLAGTAKIHGRECDFWIEEASPGLEKHLGQAALGLWGEREGRVGLVVAEPGQPRPEKLERAPGTVAFLLESD